MNTCIGTIAAIGGIVAVTVVGLTQGINGTMLTAAIATISGLAGYGIGSMHNDSHKEY